MKRKSRTHDLVILLKVFDANYVSDDDFQKLAGLDPRDPDDLREAVTRLLAPEFLTYPEGARARLMAALRGAVSDERESFNELFDMISLVFDFEVDDKRAFMVSLLQAMEQVAVE